MRGFGVFLFLIGLLITLFVNILGGLLILILGAIFIGFGSLPSTRSAAALTREDHLVAARDRISPEQAAARRQVMTIEAASAPLTGKAADEHDLRVALATGRKFADVRAERIANERVPCPHCAEPILRAARICRFCNRDLAENWAPIELTEQMPEPVPAGPPIARGRANWVSQAVAYLFGAAIIGAIAYAVVVLGG